MRWGAGGHGKVLVEQRADASPSEGGATPLWRACACNHAEIARVLLQAGVDVNEFVKDAKPSSTSCASLLHVACHSGHLQIVRLLLEFQADLNCRASGLTAVDVARASGHCDIVCLPRSSLGKLYSLSV